MKILITGGSSLLGKHLYKTAPPDHLVEGTWYSNYVGLPMAQMDVCNPSQVHYVVDRARPDAVIHCATVTKVDYAERHPEETERVCVDGAWNVMKAAFTVGARFLHVSTNAVFGGDEAPYAEDGRRRPVNLYGEIRKKAEDVVMERDGDWLVVRAFLCYGWPWPGGRRNWGDILAAGLARGKEFTLVDDRWWQPTYAGDCAEALWKLLEAGESGGVYHVAGSDRVTLYDFGCVLARVFNLDEGLLSPVGSDAFSKMAARPVDSTYDLTKVHALGIKPRGIVAGLGAMRKENPE